MKFSASAYPCREHCADQTSDQKNYQTCRLLWGFIETWTPTQVDLPRFGSDVFRFSVRTYELDSRAIRQVRVNQHFLAGMIKVETAE